MKHVFDSDQFTDLIGDPQVSLRIQQCVSNLVNGAEQAQKGAHDEIMNEGVGALPGLIQATFVFWREMVSNAKAKNTIKMLIQRICNKTPSARAFFVKTGIQTNPFVDSRVWLVSVYAEMLKTSEATSDERMLLSNLDEAVRKTSRDLREFMPLYSLFEPGKAYELGKSCLVADVSSGTVEGVVSALGVLKDIGSNSNANIGELVVVFCKGLKRDRVGGWHTVKEFLEILRQYPIPITDGNCDSVFSALNAVLERGTNPLKRDAYVEVLFKTSVRNALQASPQLLEKFDETIMLNEHLKKYWFLTVLADGWWKKKVISSYFSKKDYSQYDAEYAQQLALQYYYMRDREALNGSWLEQAVNVIGVSRPWMVRDAENTAEVIKTKKRSDDAQAAHGGDNRTSAKVKAAR